MGLNAARHEEKSISLSGIEPQLPGRRACSIVISTELSQILRRIYLLKNLTTDVVLVYLAIHGTL
jgi:hypothetical protein